MADNLTTQSATLATVPASSVISTEEVTTLNAGAVSAQHVQRVGLALRTADATAIDLPGSTADGLLVNLGSNNDVTVSGTVTATVTGVATAANQATEITSLASIDGKITAVNTGAVVVSSSALPSGASTSAKQDTGNTSLASIDGKITAVNTGAVVVSSSALPSGASTAAKQPALGTAGTPSADVITVQGVTSMTALKVDGSAVTQPVSAASLPLPSGAATSALQGGGLPVALGAGGGLKVDGSGTDLPVSLASVPSHAVTNAGTFATQVDGAALTALQLIDDPVFADDAAFTVGTSKVNMAGGVTAAFGSAPDAADAGDAAAPLMNRHRIPFTLGGHPNVKTSVYNTTAAGTDDNIMAAISTGTKYAVTKITCTLDEACTVGVAVRIGFGTANVPALGASQADAVDDVLAYHPGMVPGSIYKEGDGSGILGVGGDGAELRITNEVPTGGTLGVLVTWFPIES